MKGLGVRGYQPAGWNLWGMCRDTVQEIYRLEGRDFETDRDIIWHDIKQFNTYEALNFIRKNNRNIKKLGGTPVERIQSRNK